MVFCKLDSSLYFIESIGSEKCKRLTTCRDRLRHLIAREIGFFWSPNPFIYSSVSLIEVIKLFITGPAVGNNGS
jgi:hypothetical protein